MPDVTLHLGDCLDVLRSLPDGSVDAVVTDPPYGQTNESYESAIAFQPELWAECARVARPDAALVVAVVVAVRFAVLALAAVRRWVVAGLPPERTLPPPLPRRPDPLQPAARFALETLKRIAAKR